MSKSGYPGHDAMRSKAERAFGSAELRGYDKPSKPSDKYGCMKASMCGEMRNGRVKKDIGGEIQKAGIMGLPSYLIDGVGNAIKGLKAGGHARHKPIKRAVGGSILSGNWTPPADFANAERPRPFYTGLMGKKSGGKISKKPVRRNMGGMMGQPSDTADSIQQANQLLSNAAANGAGLKRGGHASHKHSMRHKRAEGGAMDTIGDRDFAMGKKAMGFNNGGKMCGYDMGGEIKRATGGEIKKAIGGVGKIRHGQMTKRGAQIAPRARFKG